MSSALLVGYLAHAAIVGIVCFVALRLFRLSPLAAFGAVAIAALNPAYVYHSMLDPYHVPRALQYPVYQIEIIAALLMLLAFLAFVRQCFALFGVLALLALLLPVSAIILVGAWRGSDHRQSWRNACWLALPLVVWLGAKSLLRQFGDANYVLGSTGHMAWLFRPLRSVLMLPTGLYQQRVADTKAALRGHDWHSVLLHGSELLINLAWWAALVAAIVVAYRAWGRRWLTQQPEPWLIGLVFALGNLVAVLLLPATELRYAYFWFALGPAAVFAAWSRRPAGIAVAATLSVALLVPQVSSLADSLSDASLASHRAARQSARQLTQLLAALPSTVHTVYLLDDLAVQSSSPEYFARFSGFHGRLVLINNITSI